MTPEVCETPRNLTQGVNLIRHLCQLEAKKVSTSAPKSLETLLASLADLQLTLNDSQAVQAVTGEGSLLRHLQREELIGRPWLEPGTTDQFFPL